MSLGLAAILPELAHELEMAAVSRRAGERRNWGSRGVLWALRNVHHLWQGSHYCLVNSVLSSFARHEGHPIALRGCKGGKRNSYRLQVVIDRSCDSHVASEHTERECVSKDGAVRKRCRLLTLHPSPVCSPRSISVLCLTGGVLPGSRPVRCCGTISAALSLDPGHSERERKPAEFVVACMPHKA